MTSGDFVFGQLLVEPFDGALWHQYPCKTKDGRAVGPTAFNPVSKARFAGCLADPPRRMYYAGTSRSCALWESAPLRDVFPDAHGRVYLDHTQFERQRLAQARPTRPLRLIDLGDPGARRLALSDLVLRQIRDLRHTDDYAPTHDFAAALLTACEQRNVPCDGIRWPSRQCSRNDVILLYSPPGDEDLLVHSGVVWSLDDNSSGWEPIDVALQEAQLVRYGADGNLDALLAVDGDL